MTKNGYKPLAINQLSSKKISVTQKDSQSTIAQQLKNTIDTKGNSNITIEKFSEYPDVDTAGEKTAKVLVSQTLSSGKKVSYPYEVAVTVIAKPGELKTREAIYKLGEKWNTENRSRMMVSATDADGSPVNYSDSRIGATIPDELSKRIKNGRIDANIDSPVGLFFKSSGGRVDSPGKATSSYGNAVVLRGFEAQNGVESTRDAAGAFALIEEDGSPKIIATSGAVNDNDKIHQEFPGKFYVETALFSMNNVNDLSLANQSPTKVITANGDEKKQDFLDRWGSARAMSVNYGDVFKAKEAEGKIGYTQASNYTSLDTYQQPKEIFFEVTDLQFKCNKLVK